MKLTSKGQITLPRKLSAHDGLLPETEVSFAMAEGGVLIRLTGAARVQRCARPLPGVVAGRGLCTADWLRLMRQ